MRTIIIGLAPGVEKAQRVCERQGADINEVVVFTETETQRGLGMDAFRCQLFTENVRSEKDTNLNIAIVRKHLGVAGTIM